MQGARVLIVDADAAGRNTLITGLRFVGLEASGSVDATAASALLREGGIDVMVLADEFAEVARGAALCEPGIRRASIILLTRGKPGAAGIADEAVQRPVAVNHLVERIESLIRRRRLEGCGPLEFRGLSLDESTGLVRRNGTSVTLGETESRILAFLMASPERVFSRAQLLARLWPANTRVEARTIDVYMGRLRRALRQVQADQFIQTVRRSGYRFSDVI